MGSRDPRVREELGEQKRVSREGLYEEAVALADKVAAGEEFAAREKARRWLETDTPADAKAAGIMRTPLHWPLVFPEVFERGGFDAVIGNPPFLGGQEDQWRDRASPTASILVDAIGRGVRGQRRPGRLLRAARAPAAHESGQTGLIATNTLAQGDTREVGLDQLVADGVTIRRAIKSEPWPSRSAALEYCAVWTSRAPLRASAERSADGASVVARSRRRSTPRRE